MPQIRRPPRYRSPPPRRIPSLPNPIRVQQPGRNRILRIPFVPQNGSNNTEQPLLSETASSLFNDDDEFFEKKHLPVYARFPFDVSVSIRNYLVLFY